MDESLLQNGALGHLQALGQDRGPYPDRVLADVRALHFEEAIRPSAFSYSLVRVCLFFRTLLT